MAAYNGPVSVVSASVLRRRDRCRMMRVWYVGLVLRMKIACCALARSEVGRTGQCLVRGNIAS